MRFPPARGFAGSSVWQLAQSPASTSALPWAMISSDGSAAANCAADAPHKNNPTRIARIISPPRPPAHYRGRHLVLRQCAKPTQHENENPAPATKLRFFVRPFLEPDL